MDVWPKGPGLSENSGFAAEKFVGTAAECCMPAVCFADIVFKLRPADLSRAQQGMHRQLRAEVRNLEHNSITNKILDLSIFCQA